MKSDWRASAIVACPIIILLLIFGTVVLSAVFVACGDDDDDYDYYRRLNNGELRCTIDYTDGTSNTVENVTIGEFTLKYDGRNGSAVYIVPNDNIEQIVCE